MNDIHDSESHISHENERIGYDLQLILKFFAQFASQLTSSQHSFKFEASLSVIKAFKTNPPNIV
jgi:hypothetical protein